MSVLVRPVEPQSQSWKELADSSHQTSLFVSPEWLAAERPIIIGAFDQGRLTTGLVAHDISDMPTVSPYQGLLLSAYTRPAAIASLLDWLEGVGGTPVVWNSPAMVDIRPFQERFALGRIWTTYIRYTYFVTSPTPEMRTSHEAEKNEENLALLAGENRVLRRCLECSRVRLYKGPESDALVAWGVDAQGRGYFVHSYGAYFPIVIDLVKVYPSSDLNGTPAWAKALKPKLRTSYGLILGAKYGNHDVRRGEGADSA